MVTRLGTLAGEGRIDAVLVREEWDQMARHWRRLSGGAGADAAGSPAGDDALDLVREALGEAAEELDLFDAAGLACVIRECRKSKTLSEAGRRLFARSRLAKQNPNDSDRLRKYLARFGLSWERLREGAAGQTKTPA